jgi:hypothetical protein
MTGPMSVVLSISLRKLNKEAAFLLGTRPLLLNNGEITTRVEGERHPYSAAGSRVLSSLLSLAHNTPLYIEPANPNPNDSC